VAVASPAQLDPASARRALDAFKLSCPVLARRQDQSGLTLPSDWLPLCAEAQAVADPAAFFRDRFDWVRVGSGEAFATGYYEPEIRGSRTRQAGYEIPIYRKPDDLARCYGPQGTGRGRVDPEGNCVLFYTRAEIEDGALEGRNLEIGWASDPIELFFLQIQGSGRLLLPDGQVMRIGYADQNGREYVAIGRLLRERGILPPGGADMNSIIAWMRGQPDGGRALMRENPSYIFFRELTGPGPLGALNLPVSVKVSRRRGSKVRAAWCASLPVARSARGDGVMGSAGHGRRDQGAEPLRYLLGRRGGRSPGGGGHGDQGTGTDPGAQGSGRPCAACPLKKRSSGPA
jgi:membrane-bound lytic murein transglycosylase A